MANIVEEFRSMPFESMTEEAIDGFFASRGIKENRERTRVILERIGAANSADYPEGFSDGEITDDEFYALTKEELLDGTWRYFQ